MIDKFIPQVWSGKLLLELQKALVYGQAMVINRDYEGEIKDAGDTVRIHSFGPISVFNYGKNADMPAAETLSDAEISLVIDQSKGFNFQIDDIDAAQQSPKIMTEAMREAAYCLSEVADRYIAGKHTEAGTLVGTDAAPVSLTVSNIYDQLVEIGIKLSEKNVPKDNRWVVLPPWAYGLLLKDDRFISAGISGADEALYNGQVGRAAGFNIMESNNVPNTAGAKHKILAGHSSAWSFADQISNVEAYRPEKRFADAVKGLHVYGCKVVRPEALVCLTANKG